MIQCPQCFSWINDSVTDVCPNCGGMAFPPMERPVQVPSSRPAIPALGQSVRSMITGIVSVFLLRFCVEIWIYGQVTLADTIPMFVLLMSVSILWIPATILGGLALHDALAAKRQGNRTRMAAIGTVLGFISLILGGIIAVLTIVLGICHVA